MVWPHVCLKFTQYMPSPRSMAHTRKEGCSISEQYFHLQSPPVTRNTVYLKAAGKTGPSTEVTSTRCLFRTGLENKLAVWLHFPEAQAEFTDSSKGPKTALQWTNIGLGTHRWNKGGLCLVIYPKHRGWRRLSGMVFWWWWLNFFLANASG